LPFSITSSPLLRFFYDRRKNVTGPLSVKGTGTPLADKDQDRALQTELSTGFLDTARFISVIESMAYRYLAIATFLAGGYLSVLFCFTPGSNSTFFAIVKAYEDSAGNACSSCLSSSSDTAKKWNQ
jgi:hypothetical protein